MPHFATLLVDAEAIRLAEPMEQAAEGLRVTPCTRLDAARAHLVGGSFDAVLAASELPDGSALTLLDLDGSVSLPPLLVRADSAERAANAEQAGAQMGFVAKADPRVLAAVLAWYARAHAPVRDTPEASEAPLAAPEAGGGQAAALAFLGPLQEEMAHLTHALNNPLAVIAGNAQLARELIDMAPADDMVRSSLDDIAAAVQDLVGLVDAVNALRRRIAGAIDGGEAREGLGPDGLG